MTWTCKHCQRQIQQTPSGQWRHASGYKHCESAGSFLDTTAEPCCDGTGWTGNSRERCPNHYAPLDSIWFGGR